MTSYRRSHLQKSGHDYDADLAAGSLNHFMQIRESELIDEFLKGIATGPSKRYLDFACGSGRILQQISPQFGETVAVDVSASMMEQAREKVPGATFHLADLTKDDPNLGCFDLISAFRFFGNAEHSLRAAVLGALRPRVKDDGFLLINNHRNPGSLLSRVSRHTAGMDLTYDRLRDLLAQHGFSIVRQAPIGAWMLRHKWTNRRAWEGSLGKLGERLTSLPFLAPYAPDMVLLARPV